CRVYPLSLHDALPICMEGLLGLLGDPGIVNPFRIAIIAIAAVAGLALVILGLGLTAEERRWIASRRLARRSAAAAEEETDEAPRTEEHTSELQSPDHL